MDFSQMCPRYESAMDIIGKRWTGLILRVLMSGEKRFRDIREQVPELSDRMLTERLKELEAKGIIKREVYPETPVRIVYSLTPMGRDLEPVIVAVQKWAEQWMPDTTKTPETSKSK